MKTTNTLYHFTTLMMVIFGLLLVFQPIFMIINHIAKLDTKPRHVLFTGNLIDVPIMQDYAGLVFESRQKIDVIQMKVLNSGIYVPSTLVEQLGPTLVLYQFTTGPVEGYYLIVMNEQEKPIFHSIYQDRPDDDFDGFDAEEFEPQD